MAFKYKSNILDSGIKNACPPLDCVEDETPAFRFTYESISDERNFIPQYLKKPQRFNDKSDMEKCSAFGISLYQTEDFAIKKYNVLRENVNNIAKLLGTHIAGGKVLKTLGVVTPTDSEGHFDLHEYETCNLHEHFTIIKKIA